MSQVPLPHTAEYVLVLLRQMVPDMPEGAETTLELLWNDDESCLVRLRAWGVTRQRRVNQHDMRGFATAGALREMLARKAKDLYRSIPEGGRSNAWNRSLIDGVPAEARDFGWGVQVDLGGRPRPERRQRKKKRDPSEPSAPAPLRTRRAMKFGGPR